MANIIESNPAVYPTGVFLIENGQPASGGALGTFGLPLVALAERTGWLKQKVETLEDTALQNAALGPELPLAALPFPTIATAEQVLTLLPAANTAGGTIGIPSGQRLAMAVPVLAGVTGRFGGWTTPAWVSPSLDINSTYFLRAQINTSGALVCYVAKGAVSDAVPAEQRGVANAAGGCGFDSTVVDMLLAKISTGAATSVPTVEALRNGAQLHLAATVINTDTDAEPMGWRNGAPVALNWARAPKIATAALSGMSNFSDGYDEIGAEQIGARAVRIISATRSELTWQYAGFDAGGGTPTAWRIEVALTAIG